MQYFVFITHELALKNRLDKAAHELLEEHNRKIINGIDLEIFKAEINTAIATLNSKFDRCKPLKPEWYRSIGEKDWSMHNVGSCTFNLYATKN